MKTHWQPNFWSNDTLSVEYLTIRVVERLRIEDQTYFALSDEGTYRIDEANRTWRYDTEGEYEEIVWDIWGPVRDKLEHSIEKVVINGYPCKDGCFSSYGPFVLSSTPDSSELERLLKDRWQFQTLWETEEVSRLGYDLGHELDYPYRLTYADILKYPDWSINELYMFQDTPKYPDWSINEPNERLYMFQDISPERVFFPIWNLVVAPNIGVVYLARMAHGNYGSTHDAGKVGTSLSPPVSSYYKLKIEWILQNFQKGAPANP